MDTATLAAHPDLARHADRLAEAGVEDPNHLVVIAYDISARVDKFSEESVAAAAAHHGLTDRDPTGDELLAWALATRGTAEGDETVVDDDNLLTTAGLNRITALIIAAGGQAWDATHTRLGVGDSSTAAAVGQTDLQAVSNKQWVVADASYPQQANGVITIRSTFTTGLGNFAWNEWAVDEGTANSTTVTAPMMNRKAVALGTKTSAAAWVFTITITLS